MTVPVQHSIQHLPLGAKKVTIIHSDIKGLLYYYLNCLLAETKQSKLPSHFISSIVNMDALSHWIPSLTDSGALAG